MDVGCVGVGGLIGTNSAGGRIAYYHDGRSLNYTNQSKFSMTWKANSTFRTRFSGGLKGVPLFSKLYCTNWANLLSNSLFANRRHNQIFCCILLYVVYEVEFTRKNIQIRKEQVHMMFSVKVRLRNS